MHTTMGTSVSGAMRPSRCPACGYWVAVAFYQDRGQPLATLGWPSSAQRAASMPRLPLEFVRCVDCGHVYNAAFDYDAVPFSDKPNRMFNRGARWAEYLREVQQNLLGYLPPDPVVVEIGHGDGSFLAALAEARGRGRFLGFDPHGATVPAGGLVETRSALFDPALHLEELRPDLIVSRHVMEHLGNPLAFIQSLSFCAAWLGIEPVLYLEVPCVDRALAYGRTVDFYYEHNSHFTSESFHRMLTHSTVLIEAVGHGYGGEVIYAIARLAGDGRQVGRGCAALAFRQASESSREAVKAQLDELHRSGQRIAIWGGTGKSAAFLNAHEADARRFPIVVDSDPEKAGTFVPGMGQEIRHRDWLLEHPVDVIIIPPQWRAFDIVEEMRAAGIVANQILIEHGGRLIDYFQEPHPYRM